MPQALARVFSHTVSRTHALLLWSASSFVSVSVHLYVARVINVGSSTHNFVDEIDFDDIAKREKEFGGMFPV